MKNFASHTYHAATLRPMWLLAILCIAIAAAGCAVGPAGRASLSGPASPTEIPVDDAGYVELGATRVEWRGLSSIRAMGMELSADANMARWRIDPVEAGTRMRHVYGSEIKRFTEEAGTAFRRVAYGPVDEERLNEVRALRSVVQGYAFAYGAPWKYAEAFWNARGASMPPPEVLEPLRDLAHESEILKRLEEGLGMMERRFVPASLVAQRAARAQIEERLVEAQRRQLEWQFDTPRRIREQCALHDAKRPAVGLSTAEMCAAVLRGYDDAARQHRKIGGAIDELFFPPGRGVGGTILITILEFRKEGRCLRLDPGQNRLQYACPYYMRIAYADSPLAALAQRMVGHEVKGRSGPFFIGGGGEWTIATP